MVKIRYFQHNDERGKTQNVDEILKCIGTKDLTEKRDLVKSSSIEYGNYFESN